MALLPVEPADSSLLVCAPGNAFEPIFICVSLSKPLSVTWPETCIPSNSQSAVISTMRLEDPHRCGAAVVGLARPSIGIDSAAGGCGGSHTKGAWRCDGSDVLRLCHSDVSCSQPSQVH